MTHVKIIVKIFKLKVEMFYKIPVIISFQSLFQYKMYKYLILISHENYIYQNELIIGE
jgi:hypothetical protein